MTMGDEVFGVRVGGEEWGGITKRLTRGERVWIVTANPEILLEARKNPAYREAINSADVRCVDGFGLFLWLTFVLRRKIRRLTGVELGEKILDFAAARGWRVGFLGASIPEPGTAERAAENMRAKYPGLLIHAEDGGRVDSLGDEDGAGEEARHRLTIFDPQVLFVAFGHPKQEMWIQKHRNDFPNLKVIVGVGGTLDFWSGRIRRAPSWMRSIGMEWAWRLLQEPRRAARILRAVFVFPVLAFLELLRKKPLARE